jgi:RNA polymerase sigma factor (sigma-70 family)
MNQLIMIIINSKKVKKFIKSICHGQLRWDLEEDLLQFCLLQLMEKDIQKLQPIIQQNKIEDYFIGIMINQMNSSSSEFYKMYRNSGFTKGNIVSTSELDMEYDHFNLDEKIKEEAKEDLLLEKIKKAMMTCNPLKVEVFKKKYFEDMTAKEVALFYNIRVDTVNYYVKSVKKTIKDLLNQGIPFSQIKKKDHNNRRMRMGKPPITDELIQEAIERNKEGEKKISLAHEYQIAYPYLIKITKKYGKE